MGGCPGGVGTEAVLPGSCGLQREVEALMSSTARRCSDWYLLLPASDALQLIL